MNTITENKTTHTYNEFIQENSFEVFKEIVIILKEKAKNRGLNSYEHLLYNLIRCLEVNRGFSNLKGEKTEGYKLAIKNLKYNLKYTSDKDYLVKICPETIKRFLLIIE